MRIKYSIYGRSSGRDGNCNVRLLLARALVELLKSLMLSPPELGAEVLAVKMLQCVKVL